MKLRRIAILGEIGSGNLGDDYGYTLLRDHLLRVFDEFDIPVDIRPLTPGMFWQLDGYDWDAVATGCGTLLDLANGPYVQALTKAAERFPVLSLGSGISDPRHMVPTKEGQHIRQDISVTYNTSEDRAADVFRAFRGADISAI